MNIHEIEFDLTHPSKMQLDTIQENVWDFTKYLDRERKLRESDEEFEYCAALRDAISVFQDYILGYTSYAKIEDRLMFWVQQYGTPFTAFEESGICYVSYQVRIDDDNRIVCTFEVEVPIFRDALNRIAKRAKRKQNPPKK
jgi:hypothetical protein